MHGRQVTVQAPGSDVSSATPWSLAEESGQVGVACVDATAQRLGGLDSHDAAESDGHVGTLCCWALLNLSTFEPAQV